MFLKIKIMHYLKGLPHSRKLAKVITRYVKEHENYTLGQIGSIVDDFYNKSCGLGIAEDIKCLWGL